MENNTKKLLKAMGITQTGLARYLCLKGDKTIRNWASGATASKFIDYVTAILLNAFDTELDEYNIIKQKDKTIIHRNLFPRMRCIYQDGIFTNEWIDKPIDESEPYTHKTKTKQEVMREIRELVI